MSRKVSGAWLYDWVILMVTPLSVPGQVFSLAMISSLEELLIAKSGRWEGYREKELHYFRLVF